MTFEQLKTIHEKDIQSIHLSFKSNTVCASGRILKWACSCQARFPSSEQFAANRWPPRFRHWSCSLPRHENRSNNEWHWSADWINAKQITALSQKIESNFAKIKLTSQLHPYTNTHKYTTHQCHILVGDTKSGLQQQSLQYIRLIHKGKTLCNYNSPQTFQVSVTYTWGIRIWPSEHKKMLLPPAHIVLAKHSIWICQTSANNWNTPIKICRSH